jgi:hypothetical protein
MTRDWAVTACDDTRSMLSRTMTACRSWCRGMSKPLSKHRLSVFGGCAGTCSRCCVDRLRAGSSGILLRRHGRNPTVSPLAWRARPAHFAKDGAARAVLRLYLERVPKAGYQSSCIFHGKQGCTLDRSLRSDVCNSYFCGGLHDYMASSGAATPVTIIAGEGAKMRTSPVLTP